MSLNIPADSVATAYEDDDDHSQGSGKSEEDNKELEVFDDWIDEDAQKTKSLFDESIHASPSECIAYDREHHNFDILEVSSRLGLDSVQRIKLINYIRKENVPSSALANLTSENPCFTNDDYFKPVVETDPLLQLEGTDWSDSESEEKQGNVVAQSTPSEAAKKLQKLKAQLSQAKQDLVTLRQTIRERFELLQTPGIGTPEKQVEPRDDDTHYFDSYGEHEIHAVMIQDHVRTSSYARFILSNPAIFRDAVVMDVGCGTGILSLFAARAGARRVFAVEASPIVAKAQANVIENDMQDVITVIRSKVEDLEELPDNLPHVDVIISEWMGYCCLYESMLDSVLLARDKFLRKDGTVVVGEDDDEETKGQGLMVPSQCRMELVLADARDIIRDRVKFWDDVYGFHMTAMAEEVYEECIIDIVPPTALLGEAVAVKDIPLQYVTVRALDFQSPFKLTTTRSGELNAFVLYFDTFFTTDGKDLPPDAKVYLHKGEFAPGDVIKIGERRNSESGDERRRSVDALRKKKSTDLTASTDSSGPGTMDTIAEQQLSNSPRPGPEALPPPPPSPSANSPLVSSASMPTSILSTSASKRPSLAQSTTSRRESIGAGLPKPVSFSTGPKSMPTHWKQGIFLLRNPIRVRKGTTVAGSFHCRKSDSNSRELDVEIHYLVEDPPLPASAAPRPGPQEPGEAVVQMYRVR